MMLALCCASAKLHTQTPCCDFAGDLAQGWQVSYPDPANPCIVQVCAPQFFDDLCTEQIANSDLDWGDGTPVFPVLTDMQDCYTHEYQTPGVYVISTPIIRMDVTGGVCDSGVMAVTVEAGCSANVCCSDQQQFLDKIAQGWQAEVDGCHLQLCAFQFLDNDCYYLSTSELDWGDGNVVLDVLTPFAGCYEHTYSGSGVYSIKATICEADENGNICWCAPMEITITVVCAPPPPECCKDQEAFLDKIKQGWQVNQNECEVSLCAPQFDSSCYVLTWETPDWGDGSPGQPGNSPMQSCYSHTYDNSGSYEITATVCEVDSSGCICWCEQMNTVVEVDCGVPTDCCADSLGFFDRISQGFSISQQGCCINLKPKALGPCDVVTEWCFDGTCVPSSPASGAVTWCFDQSGSHEICMKAALIDPATGAICTDTVYCETITMECDSTDCVCGPWDLSYGIYAPNSNVAFQEPVNCGDTINVLCGNSVCLIGQLNCIGQSADPTCEGTPLWWQITDPNNPLLQIHGDILTPDVAICLNDAILSQPGVYIFTIYGACGTNQCTCTIYLNVTECNDICCANPDAFFDRVNEGFSLVTQQGCCIVVEPKALNDCDVVTEWCFDGVCVPGSSGPTTWCFDQSGPHEVCMKAAMIDQDGNICAEAVFCDTLELNCDQGCSCGPWEVEGVLYDNEQPAATLDFEADCGDTIEFGCNWDKLTLSGTVHCLPGPAVDCKFPNFGYAVLYAPDNGPVINILLIGNTFGINLGSAFFSVPGTYKLVVGAQCGDASCECVFYIERPPCNDICCANPDAFFDRVNEGFKWQQSGCCLTLFPTALNDCDVVTEWCIDGTCIPGPFDPANGFTWCFSESGTHEVCMKAAMIEPGGNICAEAVFCDTLELNCNQGCPCGPWKLTGVLKTNDPSQTLDFDLDCGDSILFDCPWEALSINGSFSCEPVAGIACKAELHYLLEDPSGNLLQIGLLIGANFNFTFPAGTFSQPGPYQLTIVGNCGGQQCDCVIYIVRPDCTPDCCTDEQGFIDRVNAGFSWSVDDCCISVVPNELGPCDVISEWCWGDGNCSVGPFPGNATATHCYGESGTYEVCMYVEEVDPLTGGICWEASWCDTLTVECAMSCNCNWDLSIPIPGTTGLTPDCGDTVQLNCPLVDLDISGMLNCSTTDPNCQPTTEIVWVLDRPDTLSDLTGFAAVPNFNILIPKDAMATPGLYALTLTGVCGSDTCTCTIYLQHDCPTFTSEDPGWMRQIRLVPNPASNYVYLLLPDQARGTWNHWTVTLYNANGRAIQERSLSDGKASQRFDLATLSSGAYHFVARDAAGVVRWTGQFVKTE